MAIQFEQYKKLRQQGMTPDQIKNLDTQAKGKDWWGAIDKAGKIISSIFPGKYIGEAIGTKIAELIVTPEQKKYVSPGPSPLKMAGDIGQIGLTLAAPLTAPAKTIAGRIGFGATIGAGAGLTQALKQEKPTITGTVGKTIGGAVVGTAITGAFEAVGFGLRALSNTKFMQQLASKTYTRVLQPPTKELANQIEKGLETTGKKISDSGYVGGLMKMKQQATNNVKLFGGQLDDVLTKYPNVKITKAQIIGNTSDDLADIFGALTKQQLATIEREVSKLPKTTDLKGLLNLKRQLDKQISPTFWIEPDPMKSFVQWVRYVFRKNAKVLIENSTDNQLVKSINQKLGMAVDVKELTALREAIREKGTTTIPLGVFATIAKVLDNTIFNPAITTRTVQTLRGLGAKTGQTGLRQIGRVGIITNTRQALENK